LKLYSLDTFIKTVKDSQKYKDVTAVRLAGFAAVMKSKDMSYVFDENQYIKELDKYLK